MNTSKLNGIHAPRRNHPTILFPYVPVCNHASALDGDKADIGMPRADLSDQALVGSHVLGSDNLLTVNGGSASSFMPCKREPETSEKSAQGPMPVS
ncbi:hypothetical protein PPH93_10350 [Achromobacter xylosoxidans]|uniref:hypothetical protein n=1 Tax=Alcaligenes xylosoxydans xylosoxydans TaxID=85698 RepID=UPI00156726B7|nr:hypothetical protein [Achromobacter xylosoxidans]MDC6162042.1 hypothetical protein [Achromobacter xylosoxidans]